MPLIANPSRTSNGTPVLDTDEKLRLEVEAQWFGKDKKSKGTGTIYVTEKNIIWLHSEAKEVGYSIDYHSLTLHAVSRDSKHFLHECVYCQIGFEGDDFYLVPTDEKDVKKVYDMICTCSALNPDAEEEEEALSELMTSASLGPNPGPLQNGHAH
ncbi:hypothetical protein AAMO2058_000160400 [Amorphochlora amoebiformis]